MDALVLKNQEPAMYSCFHITDPLILKSFKKFGFEMLHETVVVKTKQQVIDANNSLQYTESRQKLINFLEKLYVK